MNDQPTSANAGDEQKIVSVRFVLGRFLKEDVRKKHNIGDNEYAEIRVTNTEPNITIEKVESPSAKVTQVLKEHEINLNDL